MDFKDVLEKANKAADFLNPVVDPGKIIKDQVEKKAEEIKQENMEDKMQNSQMNASDVVQHDTSALQGRFQSGFDSISGGGADMSLSQALDRDNAVTQNRFFRAFQSTEGSDFSGISPGGADVDGVVVSDGGRLGGISDLPDQDKAKTATQSGLEMEV